MFPIAALAGPMEPVPATVAVLYNSSIPESKQLAETYAAARSIPASNLVGLALSENEEITRDEYNKTLRVPLAAEFDTRKWWERSKNPQGNLTPTLMKVRIVACMRGVPSRISREADTPAAKEGAPPYSIANEAAVDSELAFLAIDGLPLNGPLNNPYYNKDEPFLKFAAPILLVGRIDGPTFEVCKRMIKDAVETEKTGLWGMAAIDLSKKYPQGDQWLNEIVKEHVKMGIPTLIDSFPDTLPTNYPLRDLALYYGWYDWNVSGPFLNPNFRFRKGAVAVHLHSFSAAQLRNPQLNWSAPLLDRGAAATLGNVYEPYLEMTHHFDIFQDRLLKGYTLVEAAYMAVPVLSWQNLVLGDPLYRPFLHLDNSGDKVDGDREYRAIRLATDRWSSDPAKLEEMLHEAAGKLQSGVIAESIGLSDVAQGLLGLAPMEFTKARDLYTSPADKLRMDMELIALKRQAMPTDPDKAIRPKAEVIAMLKEAKAKYKDIPEVAAVTAWLNIVDPPAPAPAKAK